MRFRRSQTLILLFIIVLSNVLYAVFYIDNVKYHANNVAAAANNVWDKINSNTKTDTTKEESFEDFITHNLSDSLEIDGDSLTSDKWINNPTLFYDPRFTLSVYTHEIGLNPKSVPFAWSDWVNLTMLNNEFTKSPDERSRCKTLKSHHNDARPNFCVDTDEITAEEMETIALPIDQIPGYAIFFAPNDGDSEVQVIEGKVYLMTFMPIPMNLVFLNEEGIASVPIEGKSRMLDSSLVLYLQGLKEIMVETVGNLTKQDLKEAKEENFHFKSNFLELESRINQLNNLITNEIIFDIEKIDSLKLNRQEKMVYDSMKFSNQAEEESVYFYTHLFENEFRDWRFIPQKEIVNKKFEASQKHKLIKNWSMFTKNTGINYWTEMENWHINKSGNLTAYTPITDLNNLCYHNQSLIVSELDRYYLDCSPFINNRNQEIVDARFIDLDSGRYIEIMGVSAMPNGDINSEGNTWSYKDNSGKQFLMDDILPLKSVTFSELNIHVPSSHQDIHIENYGTIDLKSLSIIMNKKIEELYDFEVDETILDKLNDLDRV